MFVYEKILGWKIDISRKISETVAISEKILEFQDGKSVRKTRIGKNFRLKNRCEDF